MWGRKSVSVRFTVKTETGQPRDQWVSEIEGWA